MTNSVWERGFFSAVALNAERWISPHPRCFISLFHRIVFFTTIFSAHFFSFSRSTLCVKKLHKSKRWNEQWLDALYVCAIQYTKAAIVFDATFFALAITTPIRSLDVCVSVAAVHCFLTGSPSQFEWNVCFCTLFLFTYTKVRLWTQIFSLVSLLLLQIFSYTSMPALEWIYWNGVNCTVEILILFIYQWCTQYCPVHTAPNSENSRNLC